MFLLLQNRALLQIISKILAMPVKFYSGVHVLFSIHLGLV